MAWQVYEAGADALIIQDMGLLELDLPPIQLHASTQTDIRTPEKARFLQDAGLSQIVLARELDLAQIAAIRAATDPARTTIEFSCTARCAWPIRASASSATPIPAAAPTAATATRPAACPTRCWTAPAASSRTKTCAVDEGQQPE